MFGSNRHHYQHEFVRRTMEVISTGDRWLLMWSVGLQLLSHSSWRRLGAPVRKGGCRHWISPSWTARRVSRNYGLRGAKSAFYLLKKTNSWLRPMDPRELEVSNLIGSSSVDEALRASLETLAPTRSSIFQREFHELALWFCLSQWMASHWQIW